MHTVNRIWVRIFFFCLLNSTSSSNTNSRRKVVLVFFILGLQTNREGMEGVSYRMLEIKVIESICWCAQHCKYKVLTFQRSHHASLSTVLQFSRSNCQHHGQQVSRYSCPAHSYSGSTLNILLSYSRATPKLFLSFI